MLPRAPPLLIIPHVISHLPSSQRRPTRIRTDRAARGRRSCSSISEPPDDLRFASSLGGRPFGRRAGRTDTNPRPDSYRPDGTTEGGSSREPLRTAGANLCPLPDMRTMPTALGRGIIILRSNRQAGLIVARPAPESRPDDHIGRTAILTLLKTHRRPGRHQPPQSANKAYQQRRRRPGVVQPIPMFIHFPPITRDQKMQAPTPIRAGLKRAGTD